MYPFKVSPQRQLEMRALLPAGAVRRGVPQGAERETLVVSLVPAEDDLGRGQGEVPRAGGYLVPDQGRVQGPSAVAQGDLLQVPAQRYHTEPTGIAGFYFSFHLLLNWHFYNTRKSYNRGSPSYLYSGTGYS